MAEVTVSVRPIIVDLATTASLLSLSPATVQALVRAGEFPPPRKISGRRVGWVLREIDEWAEARPVSDLAPPANTGRK